MTLNDAFGTSSLTPSIFSSASMERSDVRATPNARQRKRDLVRALQRCLIRTEPDSHRRGVRALRGKRVALVPPPSSNITRVTLARRRQG